MNRTLEKYLDRLGCKGIADKRNIITDIALLLEKNARPNPTDYAALLPPDFVGLRLSQKDVATAVSCLMRLLRDEPKYSAVIVWGIGKTFDEKNVEAVLAEIIRQNRCDDETFRQISFVIEVITSTRIQEQFRKIERLRQDVQDCERNVRDRQDRADECGACKR